MNKAHGFEDVQIKRIKDVEDINKIQRIRNYRELTEVKDSWIIFGAYLDGEIVAVCGLFIYDRIPHEDYVTGTVAELGAAYTLEEYRGRGIMKILISELIHFARYDCPGLCAVTADASDAVAHIAASLSCLDGDENRIWWQLT